MSYLARIKKPEKALLRVLTKPTKAPSVSSDSNPGRRISEKTAGEPEIQGLSDDATEAVREHLEERAAIQEHDGGLSRPEAEREARRNMRIFHYRLADDPDSELVLISPGSTLEEARSRLAHQFGPDRVIEVRQRSTTGG